MSTLDVQIVRLDPMHVAYTHGFGASPESIAWEKLTTWMDANGIKFEDHQFYGFNNPNPSPGSPNYGYEQWMTVDPSVEGTEDIKIKDVEGGLYAVSRCKLTEIGDAWQRLFNWREEESKYAPGAHQWLERAVSPPKTPFEDIIMDLYLPISE